MTKLAKLVFGMLSLASFSISFLLFSCGSSGPDSLLLAVGDSFAYVLDDYPPSTSTYEVEPSSVASFNGGDLVIASEGKFTITVTNGTSTFVQEGEAVQKALSAYIPSPRLKMGSDIELSLRTGSSDAYLEQICGFAAASFEGTKVTGLQEGTAAFHFRTSDGEISQVIEIEVYDPSKPTNVRLLSDVDKTPVGTYFTLTTLVTPSSMADDVEIVVDEGENLVRMDGLRGYGLKPGTVRLHAECLGVSSDELAIEIQDASELDPATFRIYTSDYNPAVGEETTLSAGIFPAGYEAAITYEMTPLEGEWTFDEESLTVTPESIGSCLITAQCGTDASNAIYLYSHAEEAEPLSGMLTLNRRNYDSLGMQASFDYRGEEETSIVILDGDGATLSDQSSAPSIERLGGIVTAAALGPDGMLSNPVSFSTFASDPYEGISQEAFMAAFTPAASNEDAYYRSEHGLPSGADEAFGAEPVRPEYVPMGSDGEFLRNSSAIYVDFGAGYQLYDEYGKPYKVLYAAGGYLTLEDVAAYIYGFGNVPANYEADRSFNPQNSIWGIYLRLNNTFFSGDTDNYPYEPELPRIYGCGGDLRYYEVDIGGGGYNSGTSINRGSLRIVYSREYADRTPIEDLEDRYVFYTYNHYNDFQEYLNYRGGWGERFGKVTAGGQANSSTGPAPSPYVPVTRVNFLTLL